MEQNPDFYFQHEFERKTKQVARKLFTNAFTTETGQPIGVLLGGQPASGKTNLIEKIRKDNSDRQFVVINGDEFRPYHPRYDEIYQRYGTDAPRHTQPFSNQMVEWAKEY